MKKIIAVVLLCPLLALGQVPCKPGEVRRDGRCLYPQPKPLVGFCGRFVVQGQWALALRCMLF